MNSEEKQAIKDALIGQLQGVQPFALDTVRWLYYGPRGGGRTHLICTAALLEVLESGGAYLVDHSPNHSHFSEDYVLRVLHSIASKAGIGIKTSNHRRGAIYVELSEEKYENKKD